MYVCMYVCTYIHASVIKSQWNILFYSIDWVLIPDATWGKNVLPVKQQNDELESCPSMPWPSKMVL